MILFGLFFITYISKFYSPCIPIIITNMTENRLALHWFWFSNSLFEVFVLVFINIGLQKFFILNNLGYKSYMVYNRVY